MKNNLLCMIYLTLILSCSVSDEVVYNLEFINESGVDITWVNLIDQEIEIGPGFLGNGKFACLVSRKTKFSGKPMILTYYMERPEGGADKEKGQIKINLPAIDGDYNKKLIKIIILPNHQAKIEFEDRGY